METAFEKKYHSLEKSHWWFLSRRDIISKIIRKYNRNTKILEIGCSSGELIRMLNKSKYRRVFGIDISNEAINQCKNNNIKKVVQMEGSELGFKESEFDLIIASDVLEHIDDDLHAIKEWKRVLKQGGEIISFVPAFRFLWSEHDVVNKHFRRYSRSELISLFEKNRLKVIRISYWNFFLFYPIAVERLLRNRITKKSTPGSDLFRINRMVNFLIYLALMIENIYCNFFNLPLGLSLFIIARK